MAICLAGCGVVQSNWVSDKESMIEQENTVENTIDEIAQPTENVETFDEATLETIADEEEEELEEYECGLIEEYVPAQEEEVDATIKNIEPIEVYADLSTLPKEIRTVLYDNGSFYEVYDQREYTRLNYNGTHYKNDGTIEVAEWREYMVFDFDKDGEKELAVIMDPDLGGIYVEVFDVQEKKVYGYENPYRGFLDVFTDGAIGGASAYNMHMYSMLRFSGNKIINKVVAQAHQEQFFIMGQEVTEQEYHDYVGSRYVNYDLKEAYVEREIPWSQETLDAILQ